MKRRDKTRGIGFWVVLVVVAGIAVLVGYFIGMEKGFEKTTVQVGQKEDAGVQRVVSPVQKEVAVSKEQETLPSPEQGQETVETAEHEDECVRIENDIRDFFSVLDKKGYVQHLQKGMNTYEEFRRIVRKLSSQPPIPAGEGIDSLIITKNIFHLFRLLDRQDIRLIKEILQNEADTFELNLDLFYRWLMQGDRCPDPGGIRPSMEAIYQYAGFFLNTIGGRSYLTRRLPEVRLLVSYYCLLILHKADQGGWNSYGIDVFPLIAPLAKEMTLYPGLHYRNEYIGELKNLLQYYLTKR
ncbi:MAG: hypothetical protein JW821_17525 [Deltaproteobacteria bacterium]|nr:hypothetical protein [Deltaproteobacteria bacterium]